MYNMKIHKFDFKIYNSENASFKNSFQSSLTNGQQLTSTHDTRWFINVTHVLHFLLRKLITVHSMLSASFERKNKCLLVQHFNWNTFPKPPFLFDPFYIHWKKTAPSYLRIFVFPILLLQNYLKLHIAIFTIGGWTITCVQACFHEHVCIHMRS